MEFEFSPAFGPLIKFVKGLPKVQISEDEISSVSRYLGVDQMDASITDRVTFLSQTLSAQDAFLSINLSSDSIYESNEYRKSMYIREIVANNRMNLANRSSREG